MSYKFVVKQMKINDIKQGALIEEDKIFLAIEDKQTGMILPHPITNFIKSTYDRKSLSLKTQKNYAEELKQFLNYILDCIEEENELFVELKNEGISGLRLIHASSYITELTYRVKSEEIAAKKVFDADRLLTKFYFWLSKQNIIDEKVQYSEEVRKVNGRKEVYIASPFNNFELGTEYPNRRQNGTQEERLKDFGEGRLDLVNRFLRIAELESPDIALGIAFQFYGGLRKGEVVNLLRSSIKEPSKNGTGELIVDIADNQKIIFSEKKNTTYEQVKNTRTQIIFKVPIVLELLENHKKRLDLLKKSGKLKNEQALFSSIHTGNPISGIAYWERFTKVKNKFLENLLEYDEESYRRLTSKQWSTHIGRGIFTNTIVFLLGWSAEELRIARGDTNIQSSKDYIEESNVRRKTEEAIEKIAKATIQSEKKITKIEDLRGL